MIVITLTDCPIALRGDLTKWLLEIDTGVYVGRLSTRVRDELWERVVTYVKNGRATMVYSSNNEQGMRFRVHNTEWEPINFDGLELMLRPSPARIRKLGEVRQGYSNAAQRMKLQQVNAPRVSPIQKGCYVSVDIETTGLNPGLDEIIEIGAVKVMKDEVVDTYSTLVLCQSPPSKEITELTGIDAAMIQKNGQELSVAIAGLLDFFGDLPLLSHNADFDYRFIRAACEELGIPPFSNRRIDTLSLSRRLVKDVDNYRLGTMLKYFSIEYVGEHRGFTDCMSTKLLYDRLLELKKKK